MKRAEIRALKREISSRHNAGAMQALLQRSVRFGHKRLALLRCIQAEQLGIPVAPETLLYCREVADQMPRADLEKILRQASRVYSNDIQQRHDEHTTLLNSIF